MFPNSLNKVEHMAAIEKTLDDNPVTPKHTKILCSRLVELIHCSFQTSVDVDINFGDVNGTNTKHEKTVTIVNDTEQIFLFTIAKFQLGEAKEEAFSKFYIETENEERNFTLLAGGSHDVKLKFYCKLLNCYHYDYYELYFQILDDFSWSDNIEEQESSEVKSFVNNRNRSKKTKVTWSKNSTPKASDKTIKHNLINKSSLPPKVDVNKISLYKTVASKSLFANKVASVFENQMRNIESNIKPPCWDNDITDYNVVTFPHIHPGCCISVNIPLYNPSQHTILYEFELINNVDSWPYSENVFSLDRTNGPLFSNQFVEIRCTFHPRQCQEYSQFLKCKPTCFLSDVQMPEMFFLLRGNSVECEILCEPEHMDLGQVQSQFHIEGFFQIRNLQTSRLNFLLRCTIESDGQKIDEYNLDKMDSQYSTSLDTNGTYESNNNTIKTCQKKNKIILVNSESIRNYEDLVRKLDLMKDNTDLHKSNVAAISRPKEESTNNNEKSETSNELTTIKYVDGLAASSSFKRLGSLRNDFIILYPTIDMLGPNEYKIIEFVYHPYTSGQCRLNIQLFTLENELDITSELKYDETRCIDLLSIQYNCFDSYVEIVDVNLSKNGGSKCYSSYDYYFDFLKIPSLNEKLKPKEITRLDHTFNLPNFEAGKDVTFELLLRNITSASNFHMININHGICSGCYAKQQYPNNEHSNVRLCKHFEKYVHIEPNLVTFEDETSRGVTFSINYGTEEFSHFIRRTTGCNVTEYHTTFCIYVNNSCHSMCVVQKYIHLVIRFSTITRNKAECDRFLLPMDVSVRHQHESYVGKMLGDDGNTSDMSAASLKDPRVDFGQRKAMDSITVKFFNYKLDRTNDVQPFWLYNNTSQNVEVSVKVIDKYRKSVQIISENFVVKNNSKYPILFLLNASGTLESFVFEIMDNVTHVVRNITVTIQDVRKCPASELSKSKANLSFSSPFILSRNPLIIQPIPLHHTTTRKITLKNPYDENVVFNWDSIQIDGVLKLDVKPKFGLLKPNKCKQMSLMIHALSFPAKLKFVVLSVKFYKEKYFIEYFDTLKELCETERKRSDIYHSGSGDGVTYRELNIEEYRIHACPKPNIQTIGLQIHTYDVLEFPHQTEHQESPPDSLVYTKINPKLHKQYRKQYRPSCTVKLNKILQSDIKNIFQTMFWYLIQSKEITEVPNDTYEAMSKTSHNDCTHAISIAEDICASLFEKILYRNVCKFKDFQDDLSMCDEQQETSYASIKSYVVHAIEEELAKGDQTLDDSDEDSDDESDQDGLVDEDNARIRKSNAFGMINDYFYDILKG
ncbi:hypothetical protein M8J77_008947 [Diaphorina citri]|nr:hypothetical protein M8J77_008947 [Diaphorina citri]